MAKPEATAVRNVNSYLPEGVYHQGMSMGFTGNGTPDQYYEGNHGLLWVEYKHVIKLPKELCLVDTAKKPHLSKLQNSWLKRAEDNGAPVAVILCTNKDGNFIFPSSTYWESTWNKETLLLKACSRKEIAQWITSQVELMK